MKVCSQHPSPDEQKKIMDQYKLEKKIGKNKTKKDSHYIRLARIIGSTLPTDTAMVTAALAGGDPMCKAILDSGADSTIISGKLCERIQRLMPNLHVYNLNDAISLKCRMAMKVLLSVLLTLT